MKNFKFILTTAIIATLFSCVNPDRYDTPDLSTECADLVANKSVQSVATAATASTKKYVDDDIIEAYVTSSDEGGNFYKSISFVSLDGNIGFSMPIDDYNLYTRYEAGRKVYINMKDRYFFKQYGSTVIGSLYNNDTPDIAGDDTVGRMSGVEYQSVLTASCTSSIKEVDLIKKVTLLQAKTDANLNKLIELDNVQFTDESLDKKYYDERVYSIGGATNHTIKDLDGNTAILRASQYATFATQPIPSGNGKIIGVMTKYRNDYQFMIRTLRDVQLTNPRVSPFFEETFSTNFSNWITFSVTGNNQAWALETRFGNLAPCVVMTGFVNNIHNNNEDWLITPVQDLSGVSTATLSYETATRYAGNALTVLISKNYSGAGNPNSATWTTLSGTLAPVNGSSFVWTASGPVNINSFTGAGNNAVYVAFKFTSTASASATWEVDNVKIVATK